jgi:chromosomal replication initiator protein
MNEPKTLATHAPGSSSNSGGVESLGSAVDVAQAAQALDEAIAKRVQPEQYETWFRRSALARIDEDQVVIAVQNGFARDWLENYYLRILENAVFAVLERRLPVRLVVDPELAASADIPAVAGAPVGAPVGAPAQTPADELTTSPASHQPVPATRATPNARPAGTMDDSPNGPIPATAPIPTPASARGPAQLHWNSDVVLNTKYTFDNFVVGPCNRFAHAAAMGSAEQPGKNYNPFFLHGRVGVGKTHLLQAVCGMILERQPDSHILYLSCETFVNHFISALENGDLDSFRNKYRSIDVLVVDDIHLLANKERTQEEFFHTFNTLYNAEKQIVLSSDSPPKDIPTLQDRLVSRFKWGMVTEVEPPCLETRMAIVKRKSRDKGFEFPDDVTGLIADHVTDNVRELEGAVTRLMAYSSLTTKPVTMPLAREALGELFQVRRGEPTMEDIITVVTERYGVKLSELQSKRRTNAITWPRQIAMFLARQITRHSLEEVGAYFGGRDHTTVMYAVSKVQRRLGEEQDVRDQVDQLLQRLTGRTLEA